MARAQKPGMLVSFKSRVGKFRYSEVGTLYFWTLEIKKLKADSKWEGDRFTVCEDSFRGVAMMKRRNDTVLSEILAKLIPYQISAIDSRSPATPQPTL